jgi:hypothetical protein
VPKSLSILILLLVLTMGALAQQKPQPPESGSRQYTLGYTQSDRKWQFGIHHEAYDRISSDLESKLSVALDAHGFKSSPALATGACCAIKFELLEASTRAAAIKRPGIDITVNLTVTDSSDHPIYFKGYRGESRKYALTYGSLINAAVDNAVANIVGDAALLQALNDGKAN